MSKVILRGYILVPDSDLGSVKNELAKHIELTRQEEGCLVFQVSQDEVIKNRFNVYEEFSGKQSFEMHQERVRSSSWGEITKNVERHYQMEATE